jgi:hypothetical protein
VREGGGGVCAPAGRGAAGRGRERGHGGAGLHPLDSPEHAAVTDGVGERRGSLVVAREHEYAVSAPQLQLTLVARLPRHLRDGERERGTR